MSCIHPTRPTRQTRRTGFTQMKWSDIPRNPAGKTLRQFAVAWLVFFLAAGAHRYFARGQHEIGIALGIVAVAVLVRWVAPPPRAPAVLPTPTGLARPLYPAVAPAQLPRIFYLSSSPVSLSSYS